MYIKTKKSHFFETGSSSSVDFEDKLVQKNAERDLFLEHHSFQLTFRPICRTMRSTWEVMMRAFEYYATSRS